MEKLVAMAKIRVPCGDCKKAIDLYVGQQVVNRQLVWYKSYSCPHCGSAIEEDGIGMIPYESKQAILEQEGTWVLNIQEAGDRAIVAAKNFTQSPKFSLD